MAPSWSWACYNSNVKFLAHPSGGLSLGDNFVEVDEIEAWQQSVSSNSLGAVSDGFVILHGLYCTTAISTAGGPCNDENAYYEDATSCTEFQLQFPDCTVTGTSLAECCLDRLLCEAHAAHLDKAGDALLTIAPWRDENRNPKFQGVSGFSVSPRDVH